MQPKTSVVPRLRNSILWNKHFHTCPNCRIETILVLTFFMGLWLLGNGVLKEKGRASRIVFNFKTKHCFSLAFVSSLQNWLCLRVWIIKKWWNKCQVMLYMDVLPSVGKVRSEILIINLYRSWEWRALLRVEKVKKELIGKNPQKQCERMRAPRNVRARKSLRDSVILFLFHVEKLELHKVCTDNVVVGPKPKIQIYWGETMPPNIL